MKSLDISIKIAILVYLISKIIQTWTQDNKGEGNLSCNFIFSILPQKRRQNERSFRSIRSCAISIHCTTNYKKKGFKMSATQKKKDLQDLECQVLSQHHATYAKLLSVVGGIPTRIQQPILCLSTKAIDKNLANLIRFQGRERQRSSCLYLID